MWSRCAQVFADLVFWNTVQVIHWVSEPAPGVDPLKVEVRNFDKLFKSEVILLNPVGVLHFVPQIWQRPSWEENNIVLEMILEVVRLARPTSKLH